MIYNFQKYIDNKININSEKYALIIGLKPSEGARSPKIWNKFYKKLNINCKMYPADTAEINLKKLINCISKDKKFVGAAVTMPYKETIIKHLDTLDESAKRIGSINTILKKHNKLKGYNTDYLACKNLFNKFKNKKKILILGLGGVGKAALVALTDIFKNKKINIFNRDIKKVRKFVKNLKKQNIIIESYRMLHNLENIDLIINATSVGFDLWQKKKNNFFNLKFFSPLSDLKKIVCIKTKNEKKFCKLNKDLLNSNILDTKSFLKRNKNISLIDIVYQPRKTTFMKLSEKENVGTENGLKINKTQAIKAFVIVNNIINSKLKKKIFNIL